MFKKILQFLLNIIPVLLMIGLIPFVSDDYILTGIYVGIVIISFWIRKGRKEVNLFFMGMILMTILEYFFVRTGVESFIRNSLFGLMPMWLPVLWGYGFVVIKRFIRIFNF